MRLNVLNKLPSSRLHAMAFRYDETLNTHMETVQQSRGKKWKAKTRYLRSSLSNIKKTFARRGYEGSDMLRSILLPY